MCESASPLPDDLALCHEIIRQQAETIRESQRRIEQLEHQVELLRRSACRDFRNDIEARAHLTECRELIGVL